VTTFPKVEYGDTMSHMYKKNTCMMWGFHNSFVADSCVMGCVYA